MSNVQTRDGPASIETIGTHLRSVECGTATQCEYFSREWKSSSKSCCATLWLLVGGIDRNGSHTLGQNLLKKGMFGSVHSIHIASTLICKINI